MDLAAMPMTQDPPTDYPPLAPVLAVGDAPRAIEVYRAAFGAEATGSLVDPRTGRVAHVELRLPGGPLLILEERPRIGPGTGDGRRSGDPLASPPPMRLCLFVVDADAVTAAAAAAGLQVLQAPKTHFHGHRCSLLEDVDGHQWMVSQDIGRLGLREMQARWNLQDTAARPGDPRAARRPPSGSDTGNSRTRD